jgi:hypothetical protein
MTKAMRGSFVLALLASTLVVAVPAARAVIDDTTECLIGFAGVPSDLENGGTLTCDDCDPTCDADGVTSPNQSCTFDLSVCVNRASAACTASSLKHLKVLGKCQGTASLKFVPSGTDASCGPRSGVLVKLKKKGTRAGKCKLVLMALSSDKPRRVDKDVLTLICNPQAAECPATTTTTSTSTTTIASVTTTVPGATTTTLGSTTTIAPTTTSITATTTSTTAATTTTATTTTATTTTTTTEVSTTSTTMPGNACAPIVDDAQGIAGTYQLVAVQGAKLCQTNSQQNRFGACSTDADCGGAEGSGLCVATPWATADGVVLPFPQGIKTVFTIAQEDEFPTCNHGACIGCGNGDALCAGITGCGSTPGQPDAGCIRNQCCDAPGFTIPTFLVPLLGGLCSRLDMYRCGTGVVNTSNPQTGDNEVTKTADTTDPGADCEYGTPDDPAAKACSTATGGAGADQAGKVVRTVGNGASDADGIQYRLAVPSLSTTWSDGQSPAGTCLDGSTFDPGELVITQLVLNAEFTTAGATGSFADMSGDSCALAGAGFTNFSKSGPFTLGSPPASPQPYDASAGSIAVAAGIAFSGGGPLFDIGFLAVLPNDPITRLSTAACSCTTVAGCPE